MQSIASTIVRLTDIIEAIEHVRSTTDGVALEAFEADWEKRWLVERGIEIISEASRRLPDELKTRHPQIPWAKVAGIGNVLRHDYERIEPAILWKVADDELEPLREVCGTSWIGRLPKSKAGIRHSCSKNYRHQRPCAARSRLRASRRDRASSSEMSADQP